MRDSKRWWQHSFVMRPNIINTNSTCNCSKKKQLHSSFLFVGFVMFGFFLQIAAQIKVFQKFILTPLPSLNGRASAENSKVFPAALLWKWATLVDAWLLASVKPQHLVTSPTSLACRIIQNHLPFSIHFCYKSWRRNLQKWRQYKRGWPRCHYLF